MDRKRLVTLLLLLLFVAPAWAQAPVSSGSDVDAMPSPTPQNGAVTVEHVSAPVSPGSVLNSVNPYTYRLGPGDVLSVAIIGPQIKPFRSFVAPDGSLDIYPVGKVHVEGLTVKRAELLLRHRMSAYYRNFTLTLTLVGVRQFVVQILGEVADPGRVEVDGLTNVFQAIQQAGGFTTKASRRRIEVRTGSGPSRRVDYLLWQLYGVVGYLPPLTARTVIVVPPEGPVVRISGSIKKPGQYEILDTDTLASIIAIAGGALPQANMKAVQVGRLRPNGHRQLHLLNATSPHDRAFRLQNGDSIDLTDRTAGHDQVYLTGEFNAKAQFARPSQAGSLGVEAPRRGVYDLREGQTLKDVVLAVGGPTVKADLRHCSIERRENGVEHSMPVNLLSLLNGDGRQPDIVLHNGDTITLPAMPDVVYIVGAVNRSGPVPYMNSESLREYLGLVGGPIVGASTRFVKLVRMREHRKPLIVSFDLLDVLKGLREGPKIHPGDIIYVPHTYDTFADISRVISNIFFVKSVFP